MNGLLVVKLPNRLIPYDLSSRRVKLPIWSGRSLISYLHGKEEFQLKTNTTLLDAYHTAKFS